MFGVVVDAACEQVDGVLVSADEDEREEGEDGHPEARRQEEEGHCNTYRTVT